jgi:hypothetical protein
MNHIINSSIATVLAEFLTLPICTIKTNYQNTKNNIPATIKHIYISNGIKAFYQASFPAIGSQVISSSSKYFFYKMLENHLNSNNTQKQKFINGLFSGILSSFITHPIDTFKIQWQLNKSVIPLYKNEGIMFLYRGYSKTISKVSVGSSLYFPLYDYFNKEDNPFFASLYSSLIATTVIHPIDFLKTRHIAREELFLGYNPLKYYRGYTLNLLRVIPHFMITMNVIEYLNKRKETNFM